MVVSGEFISGLGTNAAREIHGIYSRQLASLTLGDAGAAVIVERAPDGKPGIALAGFTTIAEHSRLCLGGPAPHAPGARMLTKARTIHHVAMEDAPLLLEQALTATGLRLADVDWVIPHQTSARAIRAGERELAARLGRHPKHMVVNVEDRGNTASTTHFVALHRLPRRGALPARRQGRAARARVRARDRRRGARHGRAGGDPWERALSPLPRLRRTPGRCAELRSASRTTAARACLRLARRRAEEVDLLVNAGIYKEKNTAEPALASIIQEDIGANPGHPPRPGRHGTFSFDVSNGGAGALTAAYLVDAFVGPGTARLGLVVAGDADPSPRTSEGFPFAAVAGAMLLGHRDGPEGFQRFAFHTFPEHGSLFESRLEWDAERRRNVVRVVEQPAFAEACADCAGRAALELLDLARVRGRDVDLVIASQHPAGFAARVTRALGAPAASVPAVPEALARAHTAGPIVALEAAVLSGAFGRARTVLFVAAGAGVSIAVALYARAPQSS